MQTSEDTVQSARAFLRLLEEMMDLKIQQYASAHLKLPPELSRMLQDQRQSSRGRLEQIRAELQALLERQ